MNGFYKVTLCAILAYGQFFGIWSGSCYRKNIARETITVDGYLTYHNDTLSKILSKKFSDINFTDMNHDEIIKELESKCSEISDDVLKLTEDKTKFGKEIEELEANVSVNPKDIVSAASKKLEITGKEPGVELDDKKRDLVDMNNKINERNKKRKDMESYIKKIKNLVAAIDIIEDNVPVAIEGGVSEDYKLFVSDDLDACFIILSKRVYDSMNGDAKGCTCKFGDTGYYIYSPYVQGQGSVVRISVRPRESVEGGYYVSGIRREEDNIDYCLDDEDETADNSDEEDKKREKNEIINKIDKLENNFSELLVLLNVVRRNNGQDTSIQNLSRNDDNYSS